MKKMLILLCIILILIGGNTIVFADPHAVPGTGSNNIQIPDPLITVIGSGDNPITTLNDPYTVPESD